MEEESFIKETERGREVYRELHKQIEKYNQGAYGWGKASPMVEFFIADLSEDDFYLLMRLPIGNITRIHYTQIRNRVRKERRDALWVNYKYENEESIASLFNFLEEQGFKKRPYGGCCPWIFVYLVKKEYVRGKTGIDMAGKRLIKQAVSVENFKRIYEIYENKGTLDDPEVWEIING